MPADPTDEVTWLREVEGAMTPWKWRGRAFSDGPGGVWAESSAAVFTCPNVEHADMAGVAHLRNLAPSMLAVIEAAELYVRADEEGKPWPAPAVTLRGALDAFRAAVREEMSR